MTSIDQQGKRIALVVDDDPDSLKMVSMALEQAGITVLVTTDGRSAIELTQRVEPDVILMDAVMPHMDGFETCRLLKADQNPSLTPIVFMTGLSDPEHILAGLEAGGVDYITKPVNIDELIARLSIHIVNSRLLKSARTALDHSGQAIVAFDYHGSLLWGSEKATEVADQFGHITQSAQCRHWVKSCIGQPVSSVKPFDVASFSLHFIGSTPTPEILIKIVQRAGGSKEDRLASEFGLTPREAEVLYWLTLGKTNRDISTILGLSARTVNKHLEQVFQKMGLDNRTSAAVVADRVIHQM